jgi:hypothetical protein
MASLWFTRSPGPDFHSQIGTITMLAHCKKIRTSRLTGPVGFGKSILLNFPVQRDPDRKFVGVFVFFSPDT